MRIINRLLNIFLFCFIFLFMTVVEFGVYNLIALPAGSDSTITICDKDLNGDGYSDKVTYVDTFTFLVDDLKCSISREPRFAVRSWFTWDWWQKGMKWADIALEFTIGSVVPVVAPMYEVKEIQYYYTSDTPVVSNIGNGEYTVYGLYTLTEDEAAKLKLADNADFVNTFEETYGTCFAYEENVTKRIVDGVYVNDVIGGQIYKIKDGKVEELTYWVRFGEAANYSSASWKKENKDFINVLMKINKYNSINKDGHCIYTKWTTKFLKDGEIKSSVSSLYFQLYLAIVLSLWFIRQNPITIERLDSGENMVSGGLRRRSRSHHYSSHHEHHEHHKEESYEEDYDDSKEKKKKKKHHKKHRR